MRFAIPLFLLAVLVPHAAGAEETPQPATAAAQAAPVTDDFDFFADRAAAVPAATPDPALQGRADTRKAMFKWHQGLGLTTLGLLAGTTIVGQLNYNDLYEPNAPGTGDYRLAHKALVYGSVIGFTATGALALSAPESSERSGGFDAVSLHKLGVSLATIGMLTQAGLGLAMANKVQSGDINGLQALGDAHQIAGWSTLGLLAFAATVYVW